MLDLGTDLKMQPKKHLEIVSEHFIKDLESIIGNKLIEYLQRIDYLQEVIQEGEAAALNIDR